ncbi:MAG: hypothetical protein LQ346_005825 [Caloplaca aetnensis]|nr:MAG: hypothetical protein LQ346_005825 [Caloplaca aetnensis]
MLAIPLRPQPESRHAAPVIGPSLQQAPVTRPPAPTSSANAMISVMQPPRPLTPKRPKLSLQTVTASTLPASNKSRTALNNLSGAANTPTTLRNTYENAFEVPPSTPVSANPPTDEPFTQLRHAERPSPHTASSSSSISAVSSGPTSPFGNNAPYTLPLGARSILRNSPLPRRHLANMSNRPPKRLFQPIKRVGFHESFVEMIPTPVLSDAETSADDKTVEGTSADTGTAMINAKPLDKCDGTPGRRKRRGRDWIWRPVDEAESPTQTNKHFPSTASPVAQ